VFYCVSKLNETVELGFLSVSKQCCEENCNVGIFGSLFVVCVCV